MNERITVEFWLDPKAKCPFAVHSGPAEGAWDTVRHWMQEIPDIYDCPNYVIVIEWEDAS